MKSCIYYYGIVFASLVLFLRGFFPVQQNQATDSRKPPTFLNDVEFNISQLYSQEVDRIILVVIDALRLDFIVKGNMPFLTATYPNEGCAISVHVESPTVTLPRIKALTTGSIPQFVDIILNLASTEILTDSLLHRAKEAGKKIVFYGDDTWVKLFPNVFERFEGVSSFYVNDFSEVDNNVTHNVMMELNNKDWDIMILHYLGLDHIGHVFGPFSHFIQPKLREMDRIIEIIFLASKQWDKRTLVAITGDHGMKDSGGHGGSSNSETTVPFIPIGISCKNDTVAQTDIPPTLAVLMGLTLPSGSIGRIISNMLISFPFDRLLYALHYGALSLHAKSKNQEDLLKKALDSHYTFLKNKNEDNAFLARKLYEEYSKQVSDNLVGSSVKQDIYSLLTGSALMLSCFCGVLCDIIECQAQPKLGVTKLENIVPTIIFIFWFVLPSSLILTIIYLCLIVIMLLHYLILIFKALDKWKPNCDIKTFLSVGTVLHSVSLLSSSFIEEEHQIWYFFWNTFVIVGCITALNITNVFYFVPLALGLRLLRTINQTGDKWAHLPDVSQWLLLNENYIYLQLLACFSLIFLWLCCFLLCDKQKMHSVCCALIIVLIYIFHFYDKQSSLLAKIVWFFTFVNLSLGLVQGNLLTEHVTIAWILFCALLVRSYNLILLPLCVCASLIIQKCVNRVEILTMIHIWLGKTIYFLQGHSNSLASVDVASGYIGLQEYMPSVVIIQVLSHTYAFPVLTNLLMLRHNLLQADMIWNINIVNQLAVLVTTCILILIQRHHLFVWTVFAPKLLIESCHSAVLLIEIILFYCIITSTYCFRLVWKKIESVK